MRAEWGLWGLWSVLLLGCATPAPAVEESACVPLCGPAERCVDGMCVIADCGDAGPCAAGELCITGRCGVPECRADTDCDEGRCVEGACYADDCLDGRQRPCSTACGEGSEACRGGVWRPCSARTPTVDDQCEDGLDNDCDGETDEGCPECNDGAMRMCDTACGPGAQSCDMGQWTPCDPIEAPGEACGDGNDDDCDGRVDEGCVECAEGDERPCDTPCGMGRTTCTERAWGPCLYNDAPCECPPGAAEACDNACGAGQRRCVNGRWSECDAPPVPEEVCYNGGDDDCDELIDEGCPVCTARLSVDRTAVHVLDERLYSMHMAYGSNRLAFAWGSSAGGLRTTVATFRANGERAGMNRITDAELPLDLEPWPSGFVMPLIQAGEVRMVLLSSDGRESASERWAEARDAVHADVAWNGEAFGFVGSRNLEDIFFMWGDETAFPRVESIRVTRNPGRSMEPSLVADSGGYAVAFTDERDNDPVEPGGIYFTRLDNRGNEDGVETVLARGVAPSLVWARNRYTIAFAGNGLRGLYVLQVSAEGRSMGPPRRVVSGDVDVRTPILVASQRGFGLVWLSDQQLYGVELDSDGVPIGVPSLIFDAVHGALSPQLAAVGAEYIVGWQEYGPADRIYPMGVYFAKGALGCSP